MKTIALLSLVAIAAGLTGCVAVEEKPAASQTTTTVTEESVTRAPVTETRTIRSY